MQKPLEAVCFHHHFYYFYIRQSRHGIMELLEYNMGEKVKAFSTKRGESGGNYAGFNITHYCGDSAEHIAQCRELLCTRLGIEDSHLILPRQTHGNTTIVIDELFMSAAREEQSNLLQGIDAIVTALPRTCIGVSTADCVPILLHDDSKGVIAAIHAGWRGTVSRIAKECITLMLNRFNCNTANIKAVIGPSIGCDAFEVGDEVYAAFKEGGFKMEKIAARKEKWHIDLWEANRLILKECGFAEENIEVCGVCTRTHCEEFFSARRLGINSGRIFNGIMLI